MTWDRRDRRVVDRELLASQLRNLDLWARIWARRQKTSRPRVSDPEQLVDLPHIRCSVDHQNKLRATPLASIEIPIALWDDILAVTEDRADAPRGPRLSPFQQRLKPDAHNRYEVLTEHEGMGSQEAIDDMAESAGVSTATIRKWIKSSRDYAVKL